MKKYTYLLTLIILLFSCDKGNSIVLTQKPVHQRSNVGKTGVDSREDINISGEWFYEVNSADNKLMNRTFQINIVVTDGILSGQYCAIARNGNKIDCSDDEINNLTGEIAGGKYKVNFSSFFGGKNGEAEITILNENSINWKIVKNVEGGECYAPIKCNLIKKKQTSELDGSYILKSCENGRFSIKLIKVKQDYDYLIYDKNKIISKGLLAIYNSEMPKQIDIGRIGGIFYGDSIVIQNSGNSMNQFTNFTQCDEKYLSFIRSKSND